MKEYRTAKAQICMVDLRPTGNLYTEPVKYWKFPPLFSPETEKRILTKKETKQIQENSDLGLKK